MAKKQRPGKTASAVEMAKILGVHRHTLVQWAEADSVPVESRPDPDNGQVSWQFNTADVIQALRDHDATRALERAAATAPGAGEEGEVPEGAISIDEAKRRREVANAALAEIKLHEEQRSVVRVEDVASVVEQEYGEVRSALMNLPSKVAPRVAQVTEATQAEEIVEEAVTEALEGLKNDAGRAGSSGDNAGADAAE